MPWATDADHKRADETLVKTQNVECPECDALFDVDFDTGAVDEDGMADIVPGDLRRDVECPNCEHRFVAEYDGWQNYGDAG